MSAPKILVSLTAAQFEALVMHLGCPECHTHVMHADYCHYGQTLASLTGIGTIRAAK